jgi:hypothetical protein
MAYFVQCVHSHKCGFSLGCVVMIEAGSKQEEERRVLQRRYGL